MTSLRKEGGYALVVTLLVTTLLVAVVVEFVYSVYVSTARAANFTGSQRAALLAANGIELGDKALDLLLTQDPHLSVAKNGFSFTKIEGDLSVTVRAVDELSKLSTAVVYTGTGVVNDKIHGSYTRLMSHLLGDPNLTDTLADWIDSDDEPRTYGAEGRDFYRSLRSPYDPKNGYLASLEELLMIKGYTRKVFDTINPYVTAHNNNGLVNINTAPAPVIMALSENITEELAGNLIRYRKENTFTDRSDIMKVPGFEIIGFELQDKVVVKSRLFRIYSRASAGDSEREVEAVVNVGRSILYWRER
jgi:general secretion pathway protein K